MVVQGDWTSTARELRVKMEREKLQNRKIEMLQKRQNMKHVHNVTTKK